MIKKTDLKIAVTGRARGEIAARISLSLHSLAGSQFRITLVTDTSDSDIGGNNSPIVVGKKKFHFGFANPAALARMALLGRGTYQEKFPLRAIGVFPTWDRLVFAVHKDTGIHSLEEIRERKYPLSVSTRRGGRSHTTLFAVDAVLKSYGFSLSEIEKWGGKILRAANPSGTERAEHIKSGAANAVFDEGIKSWGELALKSGMRFLPVSEQVLRGMEKIGFSSAPVTPREYPELDREVAAIDFSGWLFFCHPDLPSSAAYQMAEAIDLAHPSIPVDHLDRQAMTMREFCQGGEGGPLTIPLHPGAKKYYREKGHL
ncbi:MAG: TAXI family TRAP transporter solute-binding subunit [Candidatus Binatia bacterium]